MNDNNKRIAKNTLFLYIRMGILMFVGLYTSRVVLHALGVEDYGVYNVVGSFVMAFAFIQTPIISSIQRFLNFELGLANGRVDVIMNLSFLVHAVLVFVLFIVVELAGLWYIDCKMVLPLDRLNAAHWALHFSLFALLVTIIRSPFEALIIAHERMEFFAYISVIEVVLKLLNALLLLQIDFDKLKIYSINIFIISVTVAIAQFLFCRKNYLKEIKFDLHVPKSKLKEIFCFSGWSFLSGVASMTANQGINVLLNSFFGVIVNASMGVAVQVQVVVQQFVGNFQKAFNPQIVKFYASNDLLNMQRLVIRSSRFSFLLLFVVVCPIMFNIDCLLKMWLKQVPDDSGVFCIFLLVWSLLESLMAPLWTSVNATGKIRNYHLVMNPIILSVIGISYVALKLGYPAYSVVLIKCFVDVILLLVRMLFARRLIGLPIKKFVLESLFPITCVSIISIIPLFVVRKCVEDALARLLIGFPIFLLFYVFLVLTIGLTKNERGKVLPFIRGKISRVF